VVVFVAVALAAVGFVAAGLTFLGAADLVLVFFNAFLMAVLRFA
jgi:hypothetical protein